MTQLINLYFDDSGTKHPNKKNSSPAIHGHDWFSFGGIMIKESDEALARELITNFRQLWPQMGDAPLHSVEIRHKSQNFQWLNKISDKENDKFMSDLTGLLVNLPVIGIACVIDRPNYDLRYKQKYGAERWMLCKTAFSILIERAAKHAINSNCKLRVMPERCSKIEDAKLKSYYDNIKKSGHPFSAESSAKYSPLEKCQLSDTLYEFRLKAKTSPLMQIADLYLWPMSIGGYDQSNKPFLALKTKLIDFLYPDSVNEYGIKYFCFD